MKRRFLNFSRGAISSAVVSALFLIAFRQALANPGLECLSQKLDSKPKSESAIPTEVELDSLVSGRYEVAVLQGVEPGSPRWDRVVQLIRYSSQAMQKSRGWSERFIAERILLAERFANRSEYIDILGKSYGWLGKRVGTLGLTTAQDRPGSPREKLPMEHSLGIDLPASPLKIEARAYAIEREINPEVVSVIARELIKRITIHVASHPELMDKKIIHTYGDPTSIALYRRMGFVVDESIEPVEHEGTTWKVLSVSPADLIQTYRLKIASRYGLRFTAGEVSVQGPDGRTYVANTGGRANFCHRRGQLAEIWLASPANVKRTGGYDVPAARGSLVGWHEDGSLQYVTELSHEYDVERGLWASKSASILFHANGKVARIGHLARRTPIPGTSLVAESGAAVSFDEQGKVTFISALAERGLVFDQLWARAGTTVEFSENGRFVKFTADTKTRVSENVWASPGSSVWVRIKNGAREAIMVSELAEDFVAPNGTVVRAGHDYHYTMAAPGWRPVSVEKHPE